MASLHADKCYGFELNLVCGEFWFVNIKLMWVGVRGTGLGAGVDS